MSKQVQPQTKTAATPATSFTPRRTEVPPSKGESLAVAKTSNRGSSATAEPAFGHNFGRIQLYSRVPPRIQAKAEVSQPEDQYEREADLAASQVTGSFLSLTSELGSRPVLSHSGPMLHRQAIEGQAPGTGEAAPAGLIVEDEAREMGPGQMRKSEFLAELRSAVCTAADAELAAAGQSTKACPYLEKWFDYYSTRSGAQVERSLRKYAPETGGAKAARDYIVPVQERVRRGVARWAATGEITGVPEELASQIPEASALGAVESLASGMAGAVEQGASAVTSMLFKAQPGGAREADPQAIRSQLGPGESLDSDVKLRTGSVFGHDFSRVRVHTDARAVELCAGLNARAFTVGSDIAFGRGEYQPGTLVGDAILAHELAHVVQQGGASPAKAAFKGDGTESASLEEDADLSAVGAVVSLWSGVKGALSHVARNAMPHLRSGLKLQRCKSERQKEIERLGGVQYSYLEEKRKKEEEKQRKEAEEAAKKRGEVNPKIDVHVSMDEVMTKEVKGATLTPESTDPWLKDISEADRQDWINNRAPKAWNAVVASVKGTELEQVMKGKTGEFKPKEILELGGYAYNPSGTKILVYGMSWVKNVEADPKNVWANVAHELGGHFEYGTPYASEIMAAAIEMMPEADREKWKTDPTKRTEFYQTYVYPETEIFAALRERRYSTPVSGTPPVYGGMRPEQNIAWKLDVIKNKWAPEVAKAVLKVLRQKVDAHPEILDRDKKWFVEQVKKVLGYEP